MPVSILNSQQVDWGSNLCKLIFYLPLFHSLINSKYHTFPQIGKYSGAECHLFKVKNSILILFTPKVFLSQRVSNKYRSIRAFLISIALLKIKCCFGLGGDLELVSKDLNHLGAILHVWILWSKKKLLLFFKKKMKYFYTFNHFYSEKSSKRAK